MGKLKQINIKKLNLLFLQRSINLKDFDARLIKVDKKN